MKRIAVLTGGGDAPGVAHIEMLEDAQIKYGDAAGEGEKAERGEQRHRACPAVHSSHASANRPAMSAISTSIPSSLSVRYQRSSMALTRPPAPAMPAPRPQAAGSWRPRIRCTRDR